MDMIGKIRRLHVRDKLSCGSATRKLPLICCTLPLEIPVSAYGKL